MSRLASTCTRKEFFFPRWRRMNFTSRSSVQMGALLACLLSVSPYVVLLQAHDRPRLDGQEAAISVSRSGWVHWPSAIHPHESRSRKGCPRGRVEMTGPNRATDSWTWLKDRKTLPSGKELLIPGLA